MPLNPKTRTQTRSRSAKIEVEKVLLKLLKITEAEMRAQYDSYRASKVTGEPLTYRLYLFFHTIRHFDDFLFNKTRLAFMMMKRPGEETVRYS